MRSNVEFYGRPSAGAAHDIDDQRRFADQRARRDAALFAIGGQGDLPLQQKKRRVRRLARGEQGLARLQLPPLAGKGEQLQRLARKHVERPRARQPPDVALGDSWHGAPPPALKAIAYSRPRR